MYHKSSGVYRSVASISNVPHRISAEKSTNTVSSNKTRLPASEIKAQITFPAKRSRSTQCSPRPWIQRSQPADWLNVKIGLELHNKSTWPDHVIDLIAKSAHLSLRLHRGRMCLVFAPGISIISIWQSTTERFRIY